jgi:hypothetical protein
MVAFCTACRSIPAFNPEVQAMQKTLEDIAFLLRIPQRKPWGNMASDVAAALAAFDNRCGVAAAACVWPWLAGMRSASMPWSNRARAAMINWLSQLS